MVCIIYSGVHLQTIPVRSDMKLCTDFCLEKQRAKNGEQ